MNGRKVRLIGWAIALPFIGLLPGVVILLIFGGADENGANMAPGLFGMGGFAFGLAAGVLLLLTKWPTDDW